LNGVTNMIQKTELKRLIRSVGIERTSKQAMDTLDAMIKEYTISLLKASKILLEHKNRKTLDSSTLRMVKILKKQ